MLAQQVPVVGGADDEGVVELPRLLQGLQDHPQEVVLHRAHGPEARDGQADLFGVELVPELTALARVQARPVAQVIAEARRQWHRGRVKARRDILRRHVWVVRRHPPQVRAPGLVAAGQLADRGDGVLRLAVLERLVSGRRADGGEQGVGPTIARHPDAVAQPLARLRIARAGLAVPRGLVPLGRDGRHGPELLPATVGRALLGADMPLAGVLHPVAGTREMLGPGDHARAQAPVDGRARQDVVEHAVAAGVHAGHEAGAGGAAVGADRVRLVEQHAFPRQARGVRRGAWVRRVQHIGALVVGHDDEDIGA